MLRNQEAQHFMNLIRIQVHAYSGSEEHVKCEDDISAMLISVPKQKVLSYQ